MAALVVWRCQPKALLSSSKQTGLPADRCWMSWDFLVCLRSAGGLLPVGAASFAGALGVLFLPCLAILRVFRYGSG